MRSGQRTAAEALRWAMALALGDVWSADRVDMLCDAGRRLGWNRITSATARERCFGPAWIRSGALLRRVAGADVVAEWRRATTRLDEVGRAQLSALGEALDALRTAGVRVVVLKGATLSLRAYGEPFLRDTSDVDLYVDAKHRAQAHRALRESGWRHIDGLAPGAATYVRGGGGARAFVDIHSSLTDDPLVSHVRLPEPEWTAVEIDERSIPAHSGATLAPYLAVHLAKHTSAPLLWVLDFDAVWNALGDTERDRARALARSGGAEGYLDMAIARGNAVRAAARGDRRAQRRCGGASGLYRERHAAIVGALAAPTPLVAVRVLGRWAARRIARLGTPSPSSTTSRLAWLDRAVIRFRRRGATDGGRSVSGDPIGDRVVQLDLETSLDLVRSALCTGTPIWLVARGGSMAPTIRSGTHVLVEPRRPGDPVRAGEIVLATPRAGTPVMHRVHRAVAGQIVLRGDAMDWDDPPVEDSAVVGRVTHLRRAGRLKALGRSGALSWRTAARRLWRGARNP